MHSKYSRIRLSLDISDSHWEVTIGLLQVLVPTAINSTRRSVCIGDDGFLLVTDRLKDIIIESFAPLDREFSQEDSKITPTQKIRRRFVEQSFADETDAVYATAGT
ncbi:MAG: long-chain fatty acid--CoA ligase [bacterium]|nr:long-chain fatty acid--CoA ligase [bacterium]